MKKLYLLVVFVSGIILLSGYKNDDGNYNVINNYRAFITSANEIHLKTTQIYKNQFWEKSIQDGWCDNDRQTLLSAGFNPDLFRPEEIIEPDSKKLTMPADTTDVLSVRVYTGQTTSSYFGWTVSDAGDVNGDGYADIIIGAFGYSSNTGRAYIYYGSAVPHYTPDVVLNSDTVASRFGCSVSGAGDVNCDGYDDVIIGAFYANTNTGKAYLYFGGSSMNNTADVIMKGDTTNNYFGNSVSGAGDVNGDGYADIIVGAYRYNSYQGRSYIYYGGASVNNIADVRMTGEASSIRFGLSVSDAGDVNNDGYGDVIIGAHYYNGSQGRAYVFFGGASMDTLKDVIMTGETTSNYFGYSVSSAGDVNGDGFSDIIVGAYYYNSYQGRAYIYYGGTVMDSVKDVFMTGETTANEFGFSVSGAGDVNGDGYSDVIVGAHRYNSYQGRTYIYYGGAVMDTVRDVFMSGETNTDFGISVSGAGDVNGDGIEDVISGAYYYNSITGRAFVYTQSMKGTDIPDLIMTGESTYDYFGNSVSDAGDVNGDGYMDVIVGAKQYNSSQGRVYIFYGGPLMNNTADVIMTGEGANNYFGCSVSSAGDINSDGYADVIVGAKFYSSYTGRVYIYYGGSAMDTIADGRMTGDSINYEFGISVSGAGDVNGDGYADVIVGADRYNSYQGRTYIYYGGISMDTIADKRMNGETTSNDFGCSVSGAGDVNGDGYADVIVGADRYNSYTGRAYIYYGAANMDTIADLKTSPEETFSNFGTSVSGAGDLNGDGYSDVIVGAVGIPISDSGKVYIFYGGTVMDTIYDVMMRGESIYNDFGNSVSNAGDINRDGYSDVIIGAYEYESFTGRAYIYYGWQNMDNTYDVLLTAETNQRDFGYSVSGAGDVNGDSYLDVIVGGYGYSSYTGRAYVYITSVPPVNPTLTSVKDVPKDQGGKVYLKWGRSGYDAQGFNFITNYIVQRSYPTYNQKYSWEDIATIVPRQMPYYTYTSNTPTDSIRFFYRVIATTSSISKNYISGIMSGMSLDNISPAQVKDLAGVLDTTKIYLHWKKNTENDLSKYRIYRNDSLIAEKTDTTMNDLSVQVDSTYTYRVAAVDIHGNEGPLSDSVQFTFGEMHLNLTVLIGGFYVPSNGYMSMKDTVMVYIRNTSSPYAIIDSAKICIDSLGQATVKLPNVERNSMYYVEIVHRNSLETWSTIGGLLFDKSYTVYDFTTDSAKAYGNNMLKVGSKWCMINGDCNRDNYIDGSDYLEVFNHYDEEGYLVGDTNGDMYVDGSDYLMIFNNYDVGGISPFGKVTKKSNKIISPRLSTDR